MLNMILLFYEKVVWDQFFPVNFFLVYSNINTKIEIKYIIIEIKRPWCWESYRRLQKKGMTEDEMVDSLTDSIDMNLGKLQEIVLDRKAWRAAVHGVTKTWTWLSDWTTGNTEISQNNFCLLTVKLWTCIFTLFIIISLEINFVVFYKDIVPW